MSGPVPSVGDRRAGRTKLVVLAALFFGPLGLAFFLYYGDSGLKPGGNAAHGLLYDPARPLPDVALTGASGRPLADDPLRGRWTYLYIGDGGCAAECQAALRDSRVARALLTHDAARVRRLFLYSGTAPATTLADHEPDLAYARADDAAGRAVIGVIGAEGPPADHLYLVDPHGNLVLAYGPADRARALLEDTKRLLRYSHIG
jgi:hypothetical protein